VPQDNNSTVQHEAMLFRQVRQLWTRGCYILERLIIVNAVNVTFQVYPAFVAKCVRLQQMPRERAMI
jgi:hypothetical protein